MPDYLIVGAGCTHVFLKCCFYIAVPLCAISNRNPPGWFSTGMAEWVTTRTFKPCEGMYAACGIPSNREIYGGRGYTYS
jgi:hypothetical protein